MNEKKCIIKDIFNERKNHQCLNCKKVIRETVSVGSDAALESPEGGRIHP